MATYATILFLESDNKVMYCIVLYCIVKAICCTYHPLKYSSPNHSSKLKTRATQKSQMEF